MNFEAVRNTILFFYENQMKISMDASKELKLRI